MSEGSAPGWLDSWGLLPEHCRHVVLLALAMPADAGDLLECPGALGPHWYYHATFDAQQAAIAIEAVSQGLAADMVRPYVRDRFWSDCAPRFCAGARGSRATGRVRSSVADIAHDTQRALRLQIQMQERKMEGPVLRFSLLDPRMPVSVGMVRPDITNEAFADADREEQEASAALTSISSSVRLSRGSMACGRPPLAPAAPAFVAAPPAPVPAPMLHGLTHLDLRKCSRLTDAMLIRLAEVGEQFGGSRLCYLNVSECHRLTALGFEALLRRGRPPLATLDVRHAARLGDELLELLASVQLPLPAASGQDLRRRPRSLSAVGTSVSAEMAERLHQGEFDAFFEWEVVCNGLGDEGSLSHSSSGAADSDSSD